MLTVLHQIANYTKATGFNYKEKLRILSKNSRKTREVAYTYILVDISYFFSMITIQTYSYYFPNCLFTFCSIIMTGEITHTASKVRIVPDIMFLTEYASTTDLKMK